MKAMAFLVCLLGAGCCFADSANPPINLYGEWICCRYFDGEVEWGGTSDAKKAIGEKIDFEKEYVRFSRKSRRSFLCFPDGVVKSILYEWKKVDLRSYDDSEDTFHLQLEYRGPLEEETRPYAYLLKIWSEPEHYVSGFELAREGELTYYYNGQVFFFKKVSLGEGEEPGGFWGWMKRHF